MPAPPKGQRHIRQILGLHSLLIALFPFILLCILVGTFVAPNVKKQVKGDQAHLSTSIAARVENHLSTYRLMLNHSAQRLLWGNLPREEETAILRANLDASDSLKAIYLIGQDGRFENLVIRNPNLGQKQDLMGFDISRHWVFKEVMAKQESTWTLTYLPLVGSGISVGLGIPCGKRMLLGEINLAQLSQFLTDMATEKGQRILILDQRGQVIADPDGSLTAHQVNLNHLPLVKKALAQANPTSCDAFEFEGIPMVGTAMRIRNIQWYIMVLTPSIHVYNPIKTTFLILIAAMILTLCAGICFAMIFANRMADRFENLAGHLRRITSGEVLDPWPESDITELREFARDAHQMAQALTQREAYNRILFADSPAAMLVLDAETGLCRDCNQAALSLFGHHTPEEMTHLPLEAFSPPSQSEELSSNQGIASHTATCMEVGRVSFEWIFLRGDDSQWYGAVTFSRFTHDEKKQIQVIVHDITHEKTIEEKRRDLELQLLQAQKMESIGTLSGGIAHDFNNILFPISGYTELLQLETPKGTIQWDYLGKIMDATQRARALVKRILTYSRRNETELEGVWVHEVTREALKLVESTLPSTILIQDDIEESDGQILGNAIQIHQVIMNLCTNAFHAMEEDGGVLTVQLRTIQLTPWDVRKMKIDPGEYARITVSDTGPGMAPAVLDQIFHPYFTTKDKGKGTGLGLSMVQGIVRSHGGHIGVRSWVGSGSRFVVLLPLTRNRLQEPLDVRNSDFPLLGRGHIMVVDDEPMIVQMMDAMLTRMGYQVTTETRSNKALELFKARPRDFDLIITDMTMPGMTGYQLAENIMAVRPDTPIILCTGYSESMTREKAASIGIRGFLSKPILRQEMATMIQHALEPMALTASAGTQPTLPVYTRRKDDPPRIK
ncbi:MAG: response regulator [Desulfobacterales bacterium]|nr:response regulator [Desulfobacterales bacterium]